MPHNLPTKLNLPDLPPPINPSRLLFRFTELRSARFALILHYAKQGRFMEHTIESDGRTIGLYETAYDLATQDEAAIVMALADLLKKNDRIHCEVYGWSHRVELGYVVMALKCLIRSYEVAQPEAWCWQPHPAKSLEQEYEQQDMGLTYVVGREGRWDRNGTIRQPDYQKSPIWFFPCRNADSAMQISTRHPAPIRTQVEAAISHYQCRWCPRLDPAKLDEWEAQQWGMDQERNCQSLPKIGKF